MTAAKLVFAVGFFLGAGALAWTAESAAKDEAVAMVKKAVALIKREGGAFAKFIGEDVSEVPDSASESDLKEQSVAAARQLGRSV
ncbi:MAG TPA: hypothetical protein VGM57_11745 [Pseudolabrys sp.]|jgi:hypothetical protein